MKRTFTIQLATVPPVHWYPLNGLETTACNLPAGTPGSTSGAGLTCPRCIAAHAVYPRHPHDCPQCGDRIVDFRISSQTSAGIVSNGYCRRCPISAKFLEQDDGRGRIPTGQWGPTLTSKLDCPSCGQDTHTVYPPTDSIPVEHCPRCRPFPVSQTSHELHVHPCEECALLRECRDECPLRPDLDDPTGNLDPRKHADPERCLACRSEATGSDSD